LRVPLFVVVEEAHNIVPAKPTSFAAEALKNQLRTIAAEGRKYDVFLILVTQRPDKIDPLIVSECENRAVMRLGARAVLTKAESLLGSGAGGTVVATVGPNRLCVPTAIVGDLPNP
jgi:DNA helicase HerA-like ATPase